MRTVIKSFYLLFFLCITLALWQCAKRGSPSGGPKDETPPVLIRAEPQQLTTNFNGKEIRLFFDEYIKLQNVQDQLIISPPLKYPPEITPQGGASKSVKILIKDTLRSNTTYTFNFGQSIVDNNEGNPAPFLTYVMSTGDYIDSLSLKGSVKDAFNREADPFISVMLYQLDSVFNDSTVFKEPPTYITNTLDSATTFELNYLKPGDYALIALRDDAKNNLFDQDADKIGFVADTIAIPTDSSYTLNLFREIPNYSVPPPTYAASNKIIFGYYGGDEELKITPITELPDSVKTLTRKIYEKDSLVYWFTPMALDSIVFEVENTLRQQRDTFVVKPRKLAADSLVLSSSPSGLLPFDADIQIKATIPLVELDTTGIAVFVQDSLPVVFSTTLDTLQNSTVLQFPKEPNSAYRVTVDPGTFTDFFGNRNDSLVFSLNTGSYADFGNLRVLLEGDFEFPLILQLTDMTGRMEREIRADSLRAYEFNNLMPKTYILRAILDSNGNGKWDTGNYLGRMQAEKVIYYAKEIEVRANWELVETFFIGG